MIALTLALLMTALDEPQAKPAPAAAPAQDVDRPAISAAELKALRDNNIFSPRSAKRSSKPSYTSTRSTPVVPTKPKAPVVTGIFLDPKTQAHVAIVEDKNDASHKFFKEPKFMKPGDEWAGIKLESVTSEKAVFNRAGTTKDVHVGEALPESEEKPLGAADAGEDYFGEDGEPVPADAAASPSTSPSSGTSRKGMRSRTESRTETKPAVTTENQSRTLEEMKKRLKKNRPGDEE
jgi:hypothetical protein